ncbi:hypothetical protein JCM18918_3316 [Cutibacterium acnes JCM 18918]|nr:hypothetical protein JCM18918_3316 [Cutibacterium acnes JCM 18918]
MGLSTILIAGGMSYGPQTKAFKRGVDLVVATPGRLVDLLETGDADLSGVAVTVLDEADHMAELGFMEPLARSSMPFPLTGSACCSLPPSTVPLTSWLGGTCTSRLPTRSTPTRDRSRR